MEIFERKPQLIADNCKRSYRSEVKSILEKLVIYENNFTTEVTETYAHIYFNNFEILVHKYEDECSVIVFPLKDEEITSHDMYFLNDLIS